MKCFELECALLSLFLASLASGTNLIKRIRERQNAEDAIRTLELTGWLQVSQPVQDVLLSIDDKLRSLETQSSALKLDFSLEQMVRRMENIESKLGQLETKFDVRMKKVEEVVVSKDMKEDLSNEHISRRMENLNEKINNKVTYLDAKLEMKLERIVSKLELLERDLHNSVDDILERLVKGEEKCGGLENEMSKKNSQLDEIRTNLNELLSFSKEDLINIMNKNSDDMAKKIREIPTHENTKEITLKDLHSNINSTNHRIISMLQDNSNKIDNLSATFNLVDRARMGTGHFDMDKTATQEQLENLTALLDKALSTHEAKFKELDMDVEMYTKKVINGIQELWKTSDELKLDLSTTMEQGSRTREMVRQEFKRLHEQIEPLPKLEPKLSDISEDLDKKVFELSATVDNSFATLLVAQNTFIDSCQRIQQEETHIYDILQQIVYEMRNRSIADIHRISSELETQSSQIHKSLAHVLSAVRNITTNAVNDIVTQLNQSVILDWTLIRKVNFRNNMLDADLYDNGTGHLINEAPIGTSDYDIDY